MQTTQELDSTGILSKFEGKKVLVTGASGYIGTNLVQSLAYLPCEIWRLGRDPKQFKPIKGEAKIHDIMHPNPSVTELATNFDVIFHLAANTSEADANAAPLHNWQVNVMPLLRLLETCKLAGEHPFIVFAGTATQCGLDTQPPDRPLSTYALHKLFGEHYLRLYAHNGWAKGCTLRLANVYGPGPVGGRGMLNRMMRKALDGENLQVYNGGNYMRNYVFISDVVSAFLYAVNDNCNERAYVIGSKKPHTIFEAFSIVAKVLHELTGVEISVVSTPHDLPAIEERNFTTIPFWFQYEAHWEPQWTLEAGIRHTIEWMLK